MIGLLLNIVSGPQKIALIAGGIMLAIGSFYTWLKVHDYNIREEAIAEFNIAQEKLLEEKKAEYERKMQELQVEAAKLRDDIKKKEQDLQSTIAEIEKGIEAKGGNRPAPKYIREVVDKMQKNFGEKK